MLQSDEAERSFLREMKGELSPHDEGIAIEVLALHKERVRAPGLEDKELRALVKSFLKPLRERASARSKAKELRVTRRSDGPPTFHGWLATDPSKERMRKISKSQRILQGVARWPLGWLETDGVVCYERAAGRVAQERKGRPDAEFMKGVVKTQTLPTAVASGSDHYVVLSPGGRARFMTVEEVCRGFGVHAESALMGTMRDAQLLSDNQAVACLGRSVHVGVARCIVAELRGRGLLPSHVRYGSAYSGVDTFAVARWSRNWAPNGSTCSAASATRQ